MSEARGLQFVWWGWRLPQWPLFTRWTGYWKYIYAWSLDFGFLEVRKWSTLEFKADE